MNSLDKLYMRGINGDANAALEWLTRNDPTGGSEPGNPIVLRDHCNKKIARTKQKKILKTYAK